MSATRITESNLRALLSQYFAGKNTDGNNPWGVFPNCGSQYLSTDSSAGSRGGNAMIYGRRGQFGGGLIPSPLGYSNYLYDGMVQNVTVIDAPAEEEPPPEA